MLKSKALGTIFVERLCDISFIAILFVVSSFEVFGSVLPSFIIKAIITLLVIVAAAILVFLAIKMGKLPLQKILPKKFVIIYKNFQFAVSESLNLRSLPKIIFSTFIIWSLEFLIFYFVTTSVNLKLNVFQILFVITMANIIVAIPITPSGLGLVEAGIAGVLILMGIEKNISISVAILNNLINYWNQLIVGFFVYIKSKRS